MIYGRVGKKAVAVAALFLAGCGGSGSLRQFPLDSLARTTVGVGAETFAVWIADTPAKRAEGLMFVPESRLPVDGGMLFVFPSAQSRSFWMRDTLVPLDIIYLAADKTILNIAAGQPLDPIPLPSAGAAKYVLEVRQGTAARLSIGPGSPVTLPDGLSATE